MDVDALLGIKKPEPQAQDLGYSDEDVKERLDSDLVAMQKATAESNIAFNTFMITPDKIKDSSIHQLLAKELGLTNVSRSEAELIVTGFSLLEDFNVLGLREPTLNLHAEIIALCLAYGSVDGFARRELSTTTIGRKYEQGKPGLQPNMKRLD